MTCQPEHCVALRVAVGSLKSSVRLCMSTIRTPAEDVQLDCRVHLGTVIRRFAMYHMSKVVKVMAAELSSSEAGTKAAAPNALTRVSWPSTGSRYLPVGLKDRHGSQPARCGLLLPPCVAPAIDWPGAVCPFDGLAGRRQVPGCTGVI